MNSHKLLKSRALACIPGGVNSPVRAFRAVGGEPLYVKSAAGAYLHTEDGRSLVDFCMSFGPLILGHAHPRVVEAIRDAALRGTSFAVTTEAEIELAERIAAAIPSIEKVRLVNSGTEAVMTALRLARGFTSRPKILKFAGCYHGHTDAMLVQAGSGVVGLAQASSAGVTAQAAANTLLAPYNDFEAVTKIVREHGASLAAIIVEPLAGNMGLVEPLPGWLKHLRTLANEVGSLLIYDEVISGFRVGYGAFSNTCCAQPDITCLGKIIGGGLPIGALGARADIMDHLAPEGPVYQAGTLSGNPVSVACGLATLRELEQHNPYPILADRTKRLTALMKALAKERGIDVALPCVGSLFGVFFTEQPPRNFEEAKASHNEWYPALFHGLLKRGFYLPPAPYECLFLSIAHDEEMLETFLLAWDATLGELPNA